MLVRDAHAGVDHLDRDQCAAPSRADGHAARPGVAHRVGDEVAQHAGEQRGVAVDGESSGHRHQAQALRLGLRRELRGERCEHRGEGNACTLRRQRAGLESGEIDELAELRIEGVECLLDAADDGVRPGLDGACRECGDEQAHGVQRLAQIVACRGEKLRLRAVRRFGRATRLHRRAGLGAQLRDEVGVLVPDGQRLREQVVDAMAEGEHEREHDRHHRRGVEVDGIAFPRHAGDQRHQRGEHEAIERRAPHGGQVEPAERDAEQADDQECLVGLRRREHDDRRQSPQGAAECRAERPVAAPAQDRVGPGLALLPRFREAPPPHLVDRDQREPRQPPRRVRPGSTSRRPAARRPAASTAWCAASSRTPSRPGRRARARRARASSRER